MEPDFTSANTLIERANFHILEFERTLGIFIADDPYTMFTENDEASGLVFHKVKITKQIPNVLPAITFDIVNALRSALDHAVYDASIIVGGDPKPEYTKFPFGLSREKLENEFVRKKSQVPDSLKQFLVDFEPYKDGNHSLWGLNKIRNGKIYKTLTTMAISNGGITIGAGSGGGFIDNFDISEIGSKWDATNKELTFMKSRTMKATNIEMKITVDVVFDETTPYSGKPSLAVLRNFSSEIARVTTAIEAEARRIETQGS